MQSRRVVNTSGLSFAEIRKEDAYFVDKTLLIKDLLDKNRRGIYLYTRPRRFGKTTNITMLDAFFNLKYKGNTWFDGLRISDYPEYMAFKNEFPVIRFSLKDVEPMAKDGFESYVDRFKDVMQNTFGKFTYVLDSDAIEDYKKDVFRSVLDETIPDNKLSSCIKLLTEILETYHDRKAIVLIDEYDRAITNESDSELQYMIIRFLSSFLSSTFKDNESLQMGYITGIMQISKADMFSGLNNITVNNIFSTTSDERFGFTEPEMRDLLDYYGHPDKYDEARSWYDGYRFGDALVYNPFSIMNYISEGFVPKNYWVNTSNDGLMKHIMQATSVKNLTELNDIINGKTIEVGLRDSMTHEQMRSADETDLYSLMAMTGYLNAIPNDDGSYSVSAPNKEVLDGLQAMVQRIIGDDRDQLQLFNEFNRAVLKGDAKAMEETIGMILCNTSYLSLSSEYSYENILLTMLQGISSNYDVVAEKESGNGRSDIVLIPKQNGQIPIIVEIKKSASDNDLEKDVQKAIDQIHDRKYYLGMDRAILVGLAFHGKIPKCRTEYYST